MYAELVVAKPQSMVLTKNAANDSAPAVVCCVAATGMTGAFSSALRTLGPVIGTAAGTGVGGAADELGGSSRPPAQAEASATTVANTTNRASIPASCRSRGRPVGEAARPVDGGPGPPPDCGSPGTRSAQDEPQS